MKKLRSADYAVSAWSGGTTTQLAIWPQEAKYADRDFLWRVSSAAVELEESDFTPLPDYERLIAPLEGEIVLRHDGGAPIRLRPYEVHAFSGASVTHCTGRCRDFNLMLRRGKASGTMEALRLSSEPAALPPPATGETLLIFCVEGGAELGTGAAAFAALSLAPGEALLLSEPTGLILAGPARLMLCRMRGL